MDEGQTNNKKVSKGLEQILTLTAISGAIVGSQAYIIAESIAKQDYNSALAYAVYAAISAASLYGGIKIAAGKFENR